MNGRLANAERDEQEALLLARVARQDTRALEQLYLRFRPRLHRFLAGMGCNQGDLDHLANETFYVAWCKASSFDGSCKPSTWIFGIARNKALDHLRRERRLDAGRGEAELEAMPEPRIGGTEQLEMREWLEIALALLPLDQRNVVQLAFLDGFSYDEIAALMQCPVSTVKTRMFHARRKLKQAFPEAGARRSRQ